MRMTIKQLRRVIRESLETMNDGANPMIQVYDGEWDEVPDEPAGIEWAKDLLETDFYGRPTDVKFEGMPSPFAFLNRYSAEVSSGPILIQYCDSMEECEVLWKSFIDDI